MPNEMSSFADFWATGPSPLSPWALSGGGIFYDGGIMVPRDVVGGNMGPGTLNVNEIYMKGEIVRPFTGSAGVGQVTYGNASATGVTSSTALVWDDIAKTFRVINGTRGIRLSPGATESAIESLDLSPAAYRPFRMKGQYIVLDGTVYAADDVIANRSLIAGNTVGSGIAVLNAGTPTTSGYLAIHDPTSARLGYIGGNTIHLHYNIEKAGGYHIFTTGGVTPILIAPNGITTTDDINAYGMTVGRFSSAFGGGAINTSNLALFLEFQHGGVTTLRLDKVNGNSLYKDTHFITGATASPIMGRVVGLPTYNFLSLNGDLTPANGMGLIGGGDSDTGMYYFSPGPHIWRIAGVDKVRIDDEAISPAYDNVYKLGFPTFRYSQIHGVQIYGSQFIGGQSIVSEYYCQRAAEAFISLQSTGNPTDRKRWDTIVTGDGNLRFSRKTDAAVETYAYALAADGIPPDENSGILATTAWVRSHAAVMSSPVGSVMEYAGATPPEGWYFCDGAEILTELDGPLFDVIGYLYGGAGTVFKLPDLNGAGPLKRIIKR